MPVKKRKEMKKSIIAVVIVVLFIGCSKENNKTSYKINNVSKGIWKGSAPDHFHTGFIDVKGDFLVNSSGKIDEGDFVIPISSIENYDLTGQDKIDLLNHLKSDDFFNLLKYPEATFHITKVETYSGTDGIADANYKITGDFSLIGQTHELSFPAKIKTTSDSIFTQATFSFNRLKWGMTSFSDPSPGKLYILPDIDISLFIGAGKVKH